MNKKEKQDRKCIKNIQWIDLSETKTYLISTVTAVYGFETLLKNFRNGQTFMWEQYSYDKLMSEVKM